MYITCQRSAVSTRLDFRFKFKDKKFSFGLTSSGGSIQRGDSTVWYLVSTD